VIDADGSHDADILPRLIDAVEKGSELAVGSRRIPGGGADKWPWYRRGTSNVATLLTRAILKVPLSDPMSGFFVINRNVFERTRDKLHPFGFKILLELTILGRPSPIREIPFIFRDRHQGHSKLSIRVMWQLVKMLVLLKRRG